MATILFYQGHLHSFIHTAIFRTTIKETHTYIYIVYMYMGGIHAVCCSAVTAGFFPLGKGSQNGIGGGVGDQVTAAEEAFVCNNFV